MKLAVLVLLAAVRTPDRADILRALVNDAKMAELAYRIEYHQKVRGPLQLAQSGEARATQLRTLASNLVDPWGTPYVIEVAADGYRIAGAGSDRKFDRASWSREGEYADLAEDTVVERGREGRSTREFVAQLLTAQEKRGGGDATAGIAAAGSFDAGLNTPARAFAYFVLLDTKRYLLREPAAVESHRVQETKESMVLLGARLMGYRGSVAELKQAGNVVAALRAEPSPLNLYLYERDEWRTPFRIEVSATGYRIVSAGSDREFAPATWDRPPAKNHPAEDQVLANGQWVRAVSGDEYLKSELTRPLGDAPPPKVQAPTLDGKPVVRVGGDVKAPIATHRPEPKYPEEMKGSGRAGLIIIEAIIDAHGTVRDVKLLKSLGPEFDREAVAAVRQWKFRPGTLDGEPVAVIFNLTLSFRP